MSIVEDRLRFSAVPTSAAGVVEQISSWFTTPADKVDEDLQDHRKDILERGNGLAG